MHSALDFDTINVKSYSNSSGSDGSMLNFYSSAICRKWIGSVVARRLCTSWTATKKGWGSAALVTVSCANTYTRLVKRHSAFASRASLIDNWVEKLNELNWETLYVHILYIHIKHQIRQTAIVINKNEKV